MADEVEIEICCDVLQDAIESGGIQVVETKPGVYAEVIPDEKGETAIQINFCPFCGQPRTDMALEMDTPKQDKK